MKTLKAKPSLHLLLTLLLITSSCVPDSLTKFKEEGTKDGDSISVPDTGTTITPPTAVSEDGELVDASTISDPTTLFYTTNGTHNFVLGNTSSSTVKADYKSPANGIYPSGDLGNYTLQITLGVDGEAFIIDDVTQATRTNFLSAQAGLGFQFGTDVTTTYATYFDVNTETGSISADQVTADVLRAVTLDPISLDYYSPSNAALQTINASIMPTVSIQAPIPEKVTLQTDTAFNCTNTGTLSAAPATPQIGDVYLDSGTGICYYNYDGTNYNEVAYPFSGPIYVGFQLDTNDEFFKDATITVEDFSTDNGAVGKINYKDSNGNVYGTLTSGVVYEGDAIDNQFPFSSMAAEIINVKYFFEKDSNINLKVVNPDEPASHLSYDNSVNISITPDLPSTLRLVANVDSPLFGYIIDISGSSSHDYLETTKYTVTVENDISVKKFDFELGIINSPSDLSYSQLVAFKVKNLIQTTSDFYIGQHISTNTVPPLAGGATGIVRRILDIDGNEKYLVVQMISGEFVDTASVDNYKTFLDEEAVILGDPVPLTHIVSLVSTATYTPTYIAQNATICQRYTIPSLQYAKAVVTANPVEGALSRFLFINQVHNTNDDNAARNFSASSTALEDCGTGTPLTMDELWSPVMSADFTSTANLISGMDILTQAGVNLSVSEIDNGANTALLQSTDGESIEMASLPNVQFSERRPYNYLGEDITSFTSLPTFELKRDEDSIIMSTLTTGESVTYSVSPELPQGLTLNTQTGVITGIPEIAAASKTYTITATNILGSTQSEFNILIEDYFEVTAEIESTPNFFMHKYGVGNNFNKCRIKKRDILSNPNTLASDIEGTIDIDCFLEVGENDLYSKKLKLNSLSGPGMCHSIEYTPFAYFKQKPNRTTVAYTAASSYIVQVVSGVDTRCSAATIQGIDDGIGNVYPIETYPANGIYINGQPFGGQLDDLCEGKYEGLNCDRGTVEYGDIVFTYTPEEIDPATMAVTQDSECTNTISTQEHSCAGTAEACLAGPITEELTVAEIQNGVRSVLAANFEGGMMSIDFKTPQSLASASNRYLANYINKNTCIDAGTYDEYYADSVLAHTLNANTTFSETIRDPFMAASPFYTFSCLDEHKDIMARINVHIRDWDSKFEIPNLDRTGSAIDWGMDHTGTSAMGAPYNNILDWDDYNKGNNYSACDASNAPTLLSNFTAYAGVTVSGQLNDQSLFANVDVENIIFPGTSVNVGGNLYTVKTVNRDEIKLTLPLLTTETDVAISGLLLYSFPGDRL